MKATAILHNAATRPAEAAERLRSSLTPDVLNAHPGGHDNSVAWLLWHTGREIDLQTAALADTEQVWTDRGYAEKTGIGSVGDGLGLGHTSAAAREIRSDHGDSLVDYLQEVTDVLVTYISGLSDEDLDEVIDEDWDPPVTRGVRLVSIIDDAAQHVGQAAYAVGALSEPAMR